MTLAFHRYANLFPLIEGQEFYDLAEDIRLKGLLDRVLLIEEGAGCEILDGRNRYRALVWLVSTQESLGPGWGSRAGSVLALEDLLDATNHAIFTRFMPSVDGNPLDYVWSKNFNRRHLDESQRAMAAARRANMRQGERTDLEPSANLQKVSVSEAASAAHVSERSVATGKQVLEKAAPEIVDAVDRGHLAVSAAAELAAQPVERQAEIVAALPRDAEGRLTPEVKKALAPVIKEIRAEKVAAKRERRDERERQRGQRLQALPEKNFGVAIEDFEWDHEPWSRETGVERHPSMHYETAADAHTPEEIVARCAERFACLADDCVLFKWTTIPHLSIAMKVMELQGFRYVTSLVWNKLRPGAARGPGYWVTGEHEIVLVGVRGKIEAPATAHFRSNFSAPVGDHSEKPDNIHEIVEFHWPTVPKVEFNARRVRPGWTAWGFDAPSVSPQGEIATATDATPSSSSARPSLRRLVEGDGYSQANAGDGPAPDGEPAGMEAPVSRVADGRTSDGDASDSHSDASPPLADGGQVSLAVDGPAPSDGVAPADRGTVVSDAVGDAVATLASSTAAGRADAAEPPANRPGHSNSQAPHPLDIPPFLRRNPPRQAEMDLARRDRSPPEVVDDKLQTRLPLAEDEIELRETLLAIDAGREVEWSIMRNAIGAGLASATTQKVYVTDEGRAFLAQLVGSLTASGQEARA